MRSSRPTRRHWSSSLATWAIRLLYLYPRAWRERYADEVAAVLEDYPVTLWTLCDLLVGALDVRLRGDLLPRRLLSMAHRIRTSEVAIFAAFVPFSLAWLPLHGLIFTRPWIFALSAHPMFGIAFSAIELAGFFVVPLILVGGMPLLIAALWQAIAHRRWGVSLLLTIPLCAALLTAIAVGILFAYYFYWLHQRYVGVPGAFAMVLPFVPGVQVIAGLAVIAVLGVCATAIIGSVQRTELSLPLARFSLIPAGLVTIAMVFGTIGGVCEIALVSVVAPHLGAPLLLVALIVFLLLAAAALASVALWRGVRAAFGAVAEVAGPQAISEVTG